MFAVLCVTAAMVFLASCSGEKPDEKPQPTPETPAITGEPAGSNADDASFVTNMIANHKQAVQVSGLVADRSTDQSLVESAADISASRGPEIEMMKALLTQWNADSATPPDPDRHNATVPGTVDDATVARLQTLSGQDFDVLWLRSMIAHGQGAVQIANAEIANGDNVDAVALAKQIVEKQQAEINHLQQILAGRG